ncbi:MAG: hypothetical protein K6E11_01920 [Bacilli bacterium]|nr:hypothetical protein [Bacilli bacterium]
MKPLTKKILIYSGLSLDIIVTVFLFVLSIIMLATMPETYPGFDMKMYYESHPGFITYLQANPTVYLLACVLPLVILLIGNIFLLILFINKAGKKKAALSDLSEDQKAALRAEILKEMDSPEEKK